MKKLSPREKEKLRLLLDQLERKPPRDQEPTSAAPPRTAVPDANRRPVRFSSMIELINLDEIVREIGADTPQQLKAIDTICQEEIQSLIGDDDVFRREGNAYYVIFLDRTDVEAELISTSIARRIRRAAAKVAGFEGLTTRATIAEFQSDTDDLQVAFNEIIRGYERRGRSSELPLASNLDERNPAASVPPSGQFQGLSFAFQPMWHVHSGIVSTFFCTPVRSTTGSQAQYGQDIIRPSQGIAIRSAMTTLVMDRVVETLRSLQESETVCILGVTVDVDTIKSNKHSEELFELCRQLPLKARRMLIIELNAAAERTSIDDAANAAMLLKPLCRAVTVCLPIDVAQRSLADLSATLVHAVGVNLAGTTQSETELAPKLTAFANFAAKSGKAAFARGVASLSLTTFLIGCGFRYMDGQFVAAPRDTPMSAFPLSPIDLYGHLGRALALPQ